MKKNETTLKLTDRWSHIKDANSHFSGQCKNLIKKKPNDSLPHIKIVYFLNFFYLPSGVN